MTLLSFGPSATLPPTAASPVSPLGVRPITVDNQLRPVSHLKGYVEGMRAVVHYYSAVTDGTQATYGLDHGMTALLQQYRKIKRLEIVLDGDITHSQQSQDKTFTVSGSASVSFGVVANEGDLFSMDVGDGRTGVMQVNSSQRMTAMNNSIYQIEFTLLFYTSDAARFADLESKVVQELHYVRDYAQFGKDPVVTDSVYADLRALSKLHEDLTQDYLRSFTHQGTRLLMLPGQSLKTHDPHTARALRAVVSVQSHPAIEQLRFVSDGTDDQKDQPTLWDALLARRADLLVGCRTHSRSVPAASFSREPCLRSLRYCGAEQIVFPWSPTPSLEEAAEGSAPWQPDAAYSALSPLSMMERSGQPEPAARALVGLHPVCSGGYYVLSGAFYRKEPEAMSLLEKLLWDYLEAEHVDTRSLHYLVSNHRAWGGAERYFYTPLVLILIRYVLQNAQ